MGVTEPQRGYARLCHEDTVAGSKTILFKHSSLQWQCQSLLCCIAEPLELSVGYVQGEMAGFLSPHCGLLWAPEAMLALTLVKLSKNLKGTNRHRLFEVYALKFLLWEQPHFHVEVCVQVMKS